MADNIILEKGFRNPTEVSRDKYIMTHLTTNTVPVKFLVQEYKMEPSFIQSLPKGPKGHYNTVRDLRYANKSGIAPLPSLTICSLYVHHHLAQLNLGLVQALQLHYDTLCPVPTGSV